jgi:hypothetical protein
MIHPCQFSEKVWPTTQYVFNDKCHWNRVVKLDKNERNSYYCKGMEANKKYRWDYEIYSSEENKILARLKGDRPLEACINHGAMPFMCMKAINLPSVTKKGEFKAKIKNDGITLFVFNKTNKQIRVLVRFNVVPAGRFEMDEENSYTFDDY